MQILGEELRMYRFLHLENIVLVRIRNTSSLLLLYLSFMRNMYIQYIYAVCMVTIKLEAKRVLVLTEIIFH